MSQQVAWTEPKASNKVSPMVTTGSSGKYAAKRVSASKRRLIMLCSAVVLLAVVGIALGVVMGGGAVTHQVAAEFIAQGTVSDYQQAQRSAIANVFASEVGVAAEDVAVSVTAASVRISVEVTCASAAAASTAAQTLVRGSFSSSSALEAALAAGGVSIVVEAISLGPVAMVAGESLPPRPPGPPPPTPSPPPAVTEQLTLPASALGLLCTLTYVVGSGRAQIPLARSYDGEAWEVLSGGFERGFDSQIGANCAVSTAACIVHLERQFHDTFAIERFNASAAFAASPATQQERDAARLLMQATFGPNRSEIDSLAADLTGTAVRSWLDTQLALPPTLHRAHYRARSSPRLLENGAATLAPARACDAGSRWRRFAISALDETKVLTLQRPAGDGGPVQLLVDGVLRAEIASSEIASSPLDASVETFADERGAYTLAFEGRCHEPIGSLAECTAAALALNLTWHGYYSTGTVGAGAAAGEAIDDGRSASVSGPAGCYLEGHAWRTLKFNVAGGNTGLCGNGYDICLCRALLITATPASLRICRAEEKLRGDVRLAPLTAGARGCSQTGTTAAWFTIRNPPISFAATSPPHAQAFATSDVQLVPITAEAGAFILTASPAGCVLNGGREPALLSAGDVWYAHDRTVVYQANTLASPAVFSAGASGVVDGTRAACPTAPKTCAAHPPPWRGHGFFLRSPALCAVRQLPLVPVLRIRSFNARSCVRTSTCGPVRYTSSHFSLNTTMMRLYYEAAGLLVYEVRGLRLQGTAGSVNPCEPGATTRWRRSDGACATDTPVDAPTVAAIEAAITGSTDANAQLRDVQVAAGGASCTASANGVSTLGARRTIGGACWQHVHAHEGNVYAMSYWRLHHPGNTQFLTSESPILTPAKVSAPCGARCPPRSVRYHRALLPMPRVRVPHALSLARRPSTSP